MNSGIFFSGSLSSSLTRISVLLCNAMQHDTMLWQFCLSVHDTPVSGLASFCPHRLNWSVSQKQVFTQGDHLSGKPWNVREFDSCQGFY